MTGILPDSPHQVPWFAHHHQKMATPNRLNLTNVAQKRYNMPKKIHWRLFYVRDTD